MYVAATGYIQTRSSGRGMELQKKTKKYKNPNPPAACIILCMLVLVKQNGQQEQFRSEQPPQGAAGELKSK